MKNITTFAFAALLFAACSPSGNQTSEANQVKEELSQEFYGEEFAISNPLEVTKLNNQLGDTDSLDTQIEGFIEKTCSKMGCWLTLKLDNGESVRVTTDHEFFVPVGGCEGLRAVVNGRAFKEETTVDELRHYAEDEGLSIEEIEKITQPEYAMVVLATGIMIEGYEDDGTHHASGCDHDHDHSDDDSHKSEKESKAQSI